MIKPGLSDALIAGGCAALFSGIPSTLYAWLTGGDVMEATRAAGAMLIPASSSDRELFLAAALVHGAVSLFWTSILVPLLPRRHTVAWATLALACVALLDLRVIGQLFPEILALPFWPQFADHLAFGAILGADLSHIPLLALPVLVWAAVPYLICEDGQSIFIGGLIKSGSTQQRDAVPLLGNIPGLGYLFSNTTQTVSASETVVIITPHVIKEPQEADGLSAAGLKRVEDADAAILKQERDMKPRTPQLP